MWRRVVSQSFLVLAGRLIGASGAFLTQILIAKFWGAGKLADYLFVIAAVNIAATVMPLGFQIVGNYFAAEYRASNNDAALRAYAFRGYAHIGIAALGLIIVCPAVLFFTDVSAAVRSLWLPAFLMSTATAVVYFNGALLAGMKRPVTGLITDALFRPMLALGGFAISLVMTDTEHQLQFMLLLAGLGYSLVAAVLTVLVAREIGANLTNLRTSPAPDQSTRRRWWRYALPWAVISLATDFFLDIDLIFLSSIMTREEIAIFGVCARICSLLSFGIGLIFTMTMPDILEAGVSRQKADFHRRIGDANLLAVLFGIALTFGMLAAGPVLALLFGENFAAGSVPLSILAFGLVLRSAMGPAPLVLTFYDRPFASVPAAVIGIVTLFAANYILVPTFGLNGAACAATAAISVWSCTLWLAARHHLKLDISVLPRLKIMLAGASGALQTQQDG